MKKLSKRFRAGIMFTMALVLVSSLVLQSGIGAKADDIVWDENGECKPEDGAVYDTVEVPNGKTFIVEHNVTIRGSLTIRKGGSVFIWGDGRLNIANNAWQPEDGAVIMVESADNLPQDFEICEDDNSPIENYVWVKGVYDEGRHKWYPRVGRQDIVDESEKYLYAYGVDSRDDAQTALTRELYSRLVRVPMYGSFSIPDERGGIDAGIATLGRRIERVGEEHELEGVNGANNVNIKYSQFRVNWGYDMEDPSEEIYSILTVYYSSEIGDDGLLINTDYSHNARTGRTNANGDWFLKHLPTDIGDFSYSGSRGVLVEADSFNKVKAGGNACYITPGNTDGLFTLEVSTRDGYSTIENESYRQTYDAIIRVLNPGAPYVALIKAEGEDLNVDPLGINNSTNDVVWRAGESTMAITYIGYTSVYIEPIIVAGFNAPEIIGVELDDPTQNDGVEIEEKDAQGRFKINFLSNYYDIVPLNITFDGGQTCTLTIQRIGLVFSYKFLYDDGDRDKIETVCNGGEYEFHYDYGSGEQIVVYATYYHPGNYETVADGDDIFLNVNYGDGNSEIIAPDCHFDPARGGVGTTSFILGFLPAHDEDGNDIPFQYFCEGGLSATVINAGYDDPDTYGGTQVGSGNGVYWDCEVSWSSNN